MPHFLVTGGCGFIGSHLVEHLQCQGHRVRVLDDLSSGKLSNVSPETEVIVGSILDGDLVRRCFKGVDGCYHLAAIPSVSRSTTDPIGTHRVNLTGFLEVVDGARNAKHGTPVPVVYASSAAVYGESAVLPLHEDQHVMPLSGYGADKRGCELHGYVATVVQQVPCVGFRFFNVYGPRQDPNSPYSGVISRFAEAIPRGASIEIFGDGEQTRDFVFVGDVVRFLVRGLEAAGALAPGIFNVCTGRATSVRQLAEEMFSLCNAPVSIRWQAPRAADIRHSLGDPGKATKMLGAKAEVTLREGLAQTLYWIHGTSETAGKDVAESVT